MHYAVGIGLPELVHIQTIQLYHYVIQGFPKKNALAESSSCKLTRQRDPLRLLGACKPGLWAWMDCRAAIMILKVRFFWDTLYNTQFV